MVKQPHVLIVVMPSGNLVCCVYGISFLFLTIFLLTLILISDAPILKLIDIPICTDIKGKYLRIPNTDTNMEGGMWGCFTVGGWGDFLL